MISARPMRVVIPFAALFTGAVLIGCASHPESNSTSSASSDQSAAPVASNSSSAAAPKHAAAHGVENRLYYPTGEKDSSMLMLEKTYPAQARVGKPYNYQITLTNLTSAPLQGVTVHEMLPGSFAIAANGEPGAPATQPTKDGSMIQRTHAIGELAPNEARTISLTGTPSQTGALNSCTSVECNPTLCTAAVVINPQLKITKEAVGTGDLCQPQILRYTIANSGTGDVTGVHVDDALPDGLTLQQNGTGRVNVNVGQLAQGQSKTFDVKVKAARVGEFASAATASADDGITAKSEAANIAIKAPKLQVTLKAPEKEYLGSSLKYEVTVKNIGNAVAHSPVVHIDAAGDVAAANGNRAKEDDARLASYREDGQQVGELAPGATKTITVAYTPRAEGDLKVAAVASDPCAEVASADGMTRITALPALLLSAVDDHDPIHVGENVTYTITVLNQGFGADKNVRVVATLPDGEQYVSSTGASQATADGNKLTFAPVPSISPKQTLTWTVIVKATKATDVRFRVDMTSDSFPEAAVKMEQTRLY